MSTTPPSAVRSARCTHAVVSRWASTADPEALHRSGTTPQAGTPRWPHTGGETTPSLHMPRDARPARLSSLRLLAMASPPRDARRRSGRQGRASCGVCVPTPSIARRSYWIPGSYAPPWSEKRTSLLKAIEKEGLQRGNGDNNEVGRHRHIHDPGIQQEPSSIVPAAI